MATIAGLMHPTMVEHNGIMYLTGYREGSMYMRRSADGGASWMPFADGGQERLVASPADEARAGLVKLESQGRRIMVAVAQGDGIDVYVSVDDGETWVKDGRV